MNQRGLVLVVITSLCAVAANLLLRASMLRAGDFTLTLSKLPREIAALCARPMFVGGMTLYGVAAILWFRILSTQDLSLSYPLVVSLTFVMVTAGATYFFDEKITLQKILGISIILAGFVLAARS